MPEAAATHTAVTNSTVTDATCSSPAQRAALRTPGSCSAPSSPTGRSTAKWPKRPSCCSPELITNSLKHACTRPAANSSAPGDRTRTPARGGRRRGRPRPVPRRAAPETKAAEGSPSSRRWPNAGASAPAARTGKATWAELALPGEPGDPQGVGRSVPGASARTCAVPPGAAPPKGRAPPGPSPGPSPASRGWCALPAPRRTPRGPRSPGASAPSPWTGEGVRHVLAEDAVSRRRRRSAR